MALARRVAPSTPARPPTSTPITVAAAASSRVRRKRSPRSAATGSEVAVERPRSPRRSPQRYVTYWMGQGRSSCQRSRSSRTTWSVAKSPARMRAGSPGMSRTMAKTSTVTTRSAGTPAARRARTRRQVTSRSLLLEVRAMQGVERLERIPVEALEALARRPDLRLAVEEEGGGILHEDLLHPMERLQPLLRVERALLEGEEPVELVALVEGDVVAGRAPELRAEVLDGAVDVTIDGAPAEERGLDLALVHGLGRHLRQRAPLEVDHPHGHAHLTQIPLDRLDHLRTQEIATGRVMDREGEIRLAGLSEEPLGLLGVIAVVVVGLAIAVAPRGAGRVEPPGRPREEILHDGLAVDGVVERLAHPLVLEWVALGVEVDPDHPRRRWRVHDQVGILAEARRLLGQDLEDQVHVAALEGKHARARVGIGTADHRLELVFVRPGLLVRLDAHSPAPLAVHELEGATAHRRGVEIVVPDLLDLRLAVHDDPVVAEGVDEGSIWRLGGDAQGALVDHGDAVHDGQGRLADGVLSETLEAHAHRLRVDGRAIGELDVLPDLQRPRLAVLRLLPRFDEPGNHLALGAEEHQWLGDLVEDAAVVEPRGLVGVEDGHVGRHADDEGVLACGGGRGPGEDGEGEGGEAHQPDTHPPLGCRIC